MLNNILIYVGEMQFMMIASILQRIAGSSGVYQYVSAYM